MVVKEEILRASNIFVSMYIIIFAIASLLLAMISYNDPKMDMESVLSAVATTLGMSTGIWCGGADVQFADIHLQERCSSYYACGSAGWRW